MTQIVVGEYVESVDMSEENFDSGRVIAVNGDQITVAWSSGVRTTQDASLLRVAE